MKKIALQLKPKTKQEVKVERHFESPEPDWALFVKNMKGKQFRDFVSAHPQADEKLKAYVENFGGYLASKHVLGKVKSQDSGRTYTIKLVNGNRPGCNCGDWQYVKSVQGGNCKHIQMWRGRIPMEKKSSLALLVKTAFLRDLAATSSGLYLSQGRAKKQLQAGKLSKSFTRGLEQQERQPRAPAQG